MRFDATSSGQVSRVMKPHDRCEFGKNEQLKIIHNPADSLFKSRDRFRSFKASSSAINRSSRRIPVENTYLPSIPRFHRIAASHQGNMCIVTSKEDRVGRNWDEPARHVSNYHAGPARRTSPVPGHRRRYSNPGNDYRSSDASVRYVYRSSQPSVSYPRRDIRVIER